MIYLERRCVGELAQVVQTLWYVCRPAPATEWEQVLPGGRAQLVINLAHDWCTGLTEQGEVFAQAPALVVGLQHRAMLISTRDTEEMAGVVFAPWGLARWLRQPAWPFAGREIPLEAVLGRSLVAPLRDRLREETGPEGKLRALEEVMEDEWRRSRTSGPRTHPAVCLALQALGRGEGSRTVAALPRTSGVSARRLRDLFHEQIGVGPKLYARMLRFREATRRLHRGEDLPWAELALDCGFSDQSHFANEFRAFSGVDPTTYVRSSRPWAGHLSLQANAAARSAEICKPGQRQARA